MYRGWEYCALPGSKVSRQPKTLYFDRKPQKQTTTLMEDDQEIVVAMGMLIRMVYIASDRTGGAPCEHLGRIAHREYCWSGHCWSGYYWSVLMDVQTWVQRSGTAHSGEPESIAA